MTVKLEDAMAVLLLVSLLTACSGLYAMTVRYTKGRETCAAHGFSAYDGGQCIAEVDGRRLEVPVKLLEGVKGK